MTCDCGYSFATGAVGAPLRLDRSRQAGRANLGTIIVVRLLFAIVFGTLAGLVRHVLFH